MSGLIASFIIAAVYFLARRYYRCPKCGCWKTKVHTDRRLEWGTNIGNIFMEDPFYLETKTRKCRHCGQTLRSRTKDAGPAFDVLNGNP